MQNSASSNLPPVATLLMPAERTRVDAASKGFYHTIHHESVEDIIVDVKAHQVHAVLVSVAYAAKQPLRIASFVREFPRIPAVALLSEIEARTAQTVLALGRSGINRLVDVRGENGWRELRGALMADAGQGVQRIALGQLAIDLSGAPADCWRFFEILFTCSPRVTSIRLLTREFGVLPSTLMSRFFRHNLPTPKQYLAMARLVRAARLFENTGFSIANVANHLEYSSPQSFGRHIRRHLGVTAGEFRSRYDGAGMFNHFRDTLVLPFQDVLLTFQPLGNTDAMVISHRHSRHA
jgi:AraC-like DNA-binding protein